MTFDPSAPPVVLASIGQRFLARLIDGIIVGVPVVAALFATTDVGQANNSNFSLPLPFILGSLLLGALYEISLIATMGQTVGKRAMRIRVVRVDDGGLPGWGSASIRYLLPTAVGAIPILQLLALLVYLRALWDPMRQGFHDRAAGTIVVRV